MQLNVGQDFRGKAGTGAANITYSIFGDAVTTTDTFQLLAQGTLTTSVVTLYTSAAATQTLIKSIQLANTSGTAVAGVTFYSGGTATTNQLNGGFTVPANGTASYKDGNWTIYDSTGGTIGTVTVTLTGDITGSGSGSIATTLATVNASPGTTGSASTTSTMTTNAKGLVTSNTSNSIQITESQVTNLVSDLAGKQATGNYITALTSDMTATGPGSVAATLATVNSNVGSFGTATQTGTFTVNGKGLITAASNTAIQITESQVTSLTSDLALKAPLASPTFTGTVKTTGTLLPKDLEGRVFVDPTNTQGWAGADAGAWINSAYSYIHTTYTDTNGGVIELAPGSYSYSTPIVLANVGLMSIIMRGAGDGNGATILNYTATSGSAISIGGGSGNDGGGQLENFTLTGTAQGNGATGIQLGVAGTAGLAGGTLKNVSIRRFTTGINWATGGLCYGMNLINVKVQQCTSGTHVQGENNVFSGGLLGNNATGMLLDTGGTEVQAFGLALDDNTTTGVNQTATLVRATWSGCRWENAGLGTDNYYTITNGTAVFMGGSMQTDIATASTTGFVQQSGGITNFYSMWFYSAGRTVTQINNISGGYTNINAVIAPGATNILASFTSGYANADTPINSNIISSYNTALQSQLTVAGTVYYITNSGLKIPSEWTPGTGIRVGTVYTWRIQIAKTAAGTTNFTMKIHQGTAGTIADTAIFTQNWTQTAAVDMATIDVQMVYTTVGASGQAYVTINPVNHSAATAAGFGFVVNTAYTGTSTASTTLTAGLVTGLSFSSQTGVPTVTVPFVNAQVDNLG